MGLHYAYSTNRPEDGLYHQRQAVLRNAADADAGLVSFINLAWAWRRDATRSFLRVFFLMMLSAVVFVGFLLAGGFSSVISTAVGNEVLISGQNCAILNSTAFQAMDPALTQLYYFPHVSKKIENAANYAQQCYSTNASRILGCDAFVQKRLPTIVTANAPCPFNDTICVTPDQNLILDTGFLDSHEHWGINAPPSERFQFRRLVHCAPLKTEGYKTTYNDSAERSYTRYHYGRSWDSSRMLNYTYEYSNDGRREWNVTSGDNPSDYTIG